MVDGPSNKPVGGTPPAPQNDGHIPGLPTSMPTGMQKAYPANKAPAIRSWFKKNFPDMTEAQLNKAVSQFMSIEMQFLANLQKKLSQKSKEASQRMKQALNGEE